MEDCRRMEQTGVEDCDSSDAGMCRYDADILVSLCSKVLAVFGFSRQRSTMFLSFLVSTRKNKQFTYHVGICEIITGMMKILIN